MQPCGFVRLEVSSFIIVWRIRRISDVRQSAEFTLLLEDKVKQQFLCRSCVYRVEKKRSLLNDSNICGIFEIFYILQDAFMLFSMSFVLKYRRLTS